MAEDMSKTLSTKGMSEFERGYVCLIAWCSTAHTARWGAW